MVVVKSSVIVDTITEVAPASNGVSNLHTMLFYFIDRLPGAVTIEVTGGPAGAVDRDVTVEPGNVLVS